MRWIAWKSKEKELHSTRENLTSLTGCWLKIKKKQEMTWRKAFIFHCFSSFKHKNKHSYATSNFELNKWTSALSVWAKCLYQEKHIRFLWDLPCLFIRKSPLGAPMETHNFRTNQIMKPIILSMFNGAGREREIWGSWKVLVNIVLSKEK